LGSKGPRFEVTTEFNKLENALLGLVVLLKTSGENFTKLWFLVYLRPKMN